MDNRKKGLNFAFLLLFVCASPLSAAKFEDDDLLMENNSGYFKLEWNAGPDMHVIVQQSEDTTFYTAKTIYQGPDRASFISGLKSGIYYYRVKEGDGEWSDPLVVRVKHHSLKLAFTLFGVGAVVFILTALIVTIGARKTRMDG